MSKRFTDPRNYARPASRTGFVVHRTGWVIPMLFFLAILSGCLREEEMKVVYAQRCLSCHGPSGRGDGPIAGALPVKVPDFRDTVKEKTVYEIRRIIGQGKGMMPAFLPALQKWEVQDMVRMVRLLSMEGREIEWWESFEPFVWAHCSVPWQYVFEYEQEPAVASAPGFANKGGN